MSKKQKRQQRKQKWRNVPIPTTLSNGVVPSGERDEAVDHPRHYGGEEDPFETIKVLAAWLTPEELLGFCKGNAIKYLSRAGKKGSKSLLTDLKKAAWYLSYLIARLEEL